MSLLKRIGNLWRLSNINVAKQDEGTVILGSNIALAESDSSPKMAVIIKRKKVDPVDEFIGEDKDDKTSV